MEGEQQQQPSRNSSNFGVVIQPPTELNSSSNCFFNPNFYSSMDQNDPFESALSSLVSSPVASNAGAGDGFMFRELIGKLGSICNSGEISPQSCVIGSRNTSCYNTPLNSPPKLNLSSVMESQIRGSFAAFGGRNQLPSNLGLAPLNADPEFVERAAKFSCFGSRNPGFGSEFGYGSFPKLEPVNLSRVAASQPGAQEDAKDGDLGDSREGSTVSEQNPGGESPVKPQNNTNSRKRKSNPKSKGPVKEEKVGAEKDESSNAKRSKPDEDGKKEKPNGDAEENGNGKDGKKEKPNGDAEENGNGKDGKKETANAPEPPKDYIHVRARRGQATDSHSLAERVRREKISERMKFLQDLVPGCNKVTGKAVVLDEIINYVQSLQRQVEFLSMKLATVNPRMEFSMEALLSKDILQLPHTMLPLDSSASAFPYGFHSQQIPTMPNDLHHGTAGSFFPLDAAIRQNGGIQAPSTDGAGDSAPQIPSFWEDDLHSIVQMGFPQNELQNLLGANPSSQMKVEQR